MKSPKSTAQWILVDCFYRKRISIDYNRLDCNERSIHVIEMMWKAVAFKTLPHICILNVKYARIGIARETEREIILYSFNFQQIRIENVANYKQIWLCFCVIQSPGFEWVVFFSVFIHSLNAEGTRMLR